MGRTNNIDTQLHSTKGRQGNGESHYIQIITLDGAHAKET